MESLKHYKANLIPLTTLKARVDTFAQLCCPDFIYTKNSPGLLEFREIPFSEDAPDLSPDEANVLYSVGAYILDPDDGKQYPHFFTKWSRMQLLSHLGTREKWFESVPPSIEATELNHRLHRLKNRRFRRMKVHDHPGVRILRGLVSKEYGDIPDTEIMQILVRLMPDGHVAKRYSGKSDRAFYAYAVTGKPFGIPGTSFAGYPGVVVKNSEVGYCSLQIVPMMYTAEHAVIVFEHQRLLRRIHRGSSEEMEKEFGEKMSEASAVWADLRHQMITLASVKYINEDHAVEQLRRLILSCAGATKMLAYRCEQHYRSQKHGVHNGVSIFDSILAQVKKQKNFDDAYLRATIAGAVLLKLLGS